MPVRVSSRIIQPRIADIGAFKENSIAVRRGPIRFSVRNSAVSPMKMPMNPDRTSGRIWSLPIVFQPPAIITQAHSINVTSTMRVQLKAIAPKCWAGAADRRPVSAQSVAAPSAAAS